MSKNLPDSVDNTNKNVAIFNAVTGFADMVTKTKLLSLNESGLLTHDAEHGFMPVPEGSDLSAKEPLYWHNTQIVWVRSSILQQAVDHFSPPVFA